MKKIIKDIFYFGEAVEGYGVRVFNEREARAAAGLLFLFAIVGFMTALLVGSYLMLKTFIIFFFLDFLIRVIINPKYSPSLVMGRVMVSNQKVEYSGAPQKRFAWGIGLVLSIFMLVWLVILGNTGLINFSVCVLCLTFLFFESVFGICVGCKMYNMFTKHTAQLCPGGVCEIKRKEKIQEISLVQAIVVLLVLVVVFVIMKSFVM